MLNDLFFNNGSLLKDALGMNNTDSRQMVVDIIEEKESFIVKSNLPGFDKKDIKISVKDNILTISAQHSEINDSKDEKFTLHERYLGKRERSFSLPTNIDVKNIIAKYENGVLSLIITKKCPEETHEITIE